MTKGNLAASVVAALVVGFVAGYVVGTGKAPGAKGAGAGIDDISAANMDKYPAVAKGLVGHPAVGPEHAKVTIVDLSDFQ